MGKAVQSVRHADSTRLANPRTKACTGTRGASSNFCRLQGCSSSLKSAPDTIRGITNGSTCEKYFEHHCDSHLEPVCTCKAPNPCQPPLRMSAGVEEEVFERSMHTAIGRMLSMHFVTHLPASPGVLFFVLKSFNLLHHDSPFNSSSLRRSSVSRMACNRAGGMAPKRCSSGTCSSVSGYSCYTIVFILALRSKALPLSLKAS